MDFLEKIKEKVKATPEAKILCMTSIATIKLKGKDLDGTKVCCPIECFMILEHIFYYIHLEDIFKSNDIKTNEGGETSTCQAFFYQI